MSFLTLLSGIGFGCIVAVTLNAWHQRRKADDEALEAWRTHSAQIIEEMGASLAATEETVRRIRREQHTPRDAWVPRKPQDATPEQWAARHPQDRPHCDHPETVEDVQLCSTRRWVHCTDCGEELTPDGLPNVLPNGNSAFGPT